MIEIALTKKLATVVKQELTGVDQNTNPLFMWTANIIDVFENNKEELLVMVNKATRFTVLIYGIKKAHFTKFDETLTTAIRNTLQLTQINKDLIEEYCNELSEVVFTVNKDRQQTSWVNRQGMDAYNIVANEYNKSCGTLKFSDSIGHVLNRLIVCNNSKCKDYNEPRDLMMKALSEYYKKPMLQYRAFELEIVLDLEIYKSIRKVIVPASLTLEQFHEVLQDLYNWEDKHFYQYIVYNEKKEQIAQVVCDEEEHSYYKDSVLASDTTLDNYFPNSEMVYTYDFGDNWKHRIKFVCEILDCDAKPPILVYAEGVTPPEDIGGVAAYKEFYKIIQDPKHPRYAEMKEWAGYWSSELHLNS